MSDDARTTPGNSEPGDQEKSGREHRPDDRGETILEDPRMPGVRTAVERLPASTSGSKALQCARVLACAAIALWASPVRAQDLSQGFSIKLPAEYGYACDHDRDDLGVRVLAHNPAVYPELAARVSNGWLVYDEYEEQVVELDERLQERRSWGRHGPGPMEYENPVGLGRLDSDHVVVVDANPPSLILLGPSRNEYRIGNQGLDPVHAAVANGRILVTSKKGELHEVALNGEVRIVHERADFGLPDTPGPEAGTANPVLRGNHIGFRGPSTIWRLGAQPTRIVQRCIPEDLVGMLEAAPMVDLGPLLGEHPISLVTMQDFLPLGEEGFLAVGALSTRGKGLRSVEHYDATGEFAQAWALNSHPAVQARFDERSVGRLLIWDKEHIDGVQLVELEGLDVAGRR